MWYTLKDFHPIKGPKEDSQETTKKKTQTWGGSWSGMQTQEMNKKGLEKDKQEMIKKRTWRGENTRCLNTKTQKMTRKGIQT